jgi:tetratricopeptide (TPR) repeat protein
MGFRVRRSLQIAPGVRFNVSKTGVGLGFGPKGLRYTVHSSGRRTVTARSGVPGLYYQSQHYAGSHATQPRPVVPQPLPQRMPKPGMFAPKAEKALYQAMLQHAQGAEVARVGDQHPEYKALAYCLGGLLMLNEGDDQGAIRLLAAAFATGEDPASHPFVRMYLYTELPVEITTGVTADLAISRDAVGLLLAEAYQRTHALAEAIDVVEQLNPTTYAAVSLADLYTEAKRFDDVVRLTDGMTNQDDASTVLLVFRGVALREQGMHEAANAAFKEALRYRSRSAEIRHLALFERAANYATQGKAVQARKDLERIIADDSTYPGVRERLAELSAK